MNHIAIMKKSWGMISKILSGEKTIESRWYKSKFAPWNKIKVGDKIYFKNSGELVTVVADVRKVLQFDNLNKDIFEQIMINYADRICLLNRSYDSYYQSKKYCILVLLDNVSKINKPFNIDKTGYGMSCAWMVVEDLDKIKK